MRFVASSVILGLGLSGCAGWTPDARFARTQLCGPGAGCIPPGRLDGLIRSILPFDDPLYPALSLEAARSELLALFPIEQEPRFLTLQRGFALFNQVDLFPYAFRAIVDQEADPLRGDHLYEAVAADQAHRGGGPGRMDAGRGPLAIRRRGPTRDRVAGRGGAGRCGGALASRGPGAVTASVGWGRVR
jgi:hypothetical protein